MSGSEIRVKISNYSRIKIHIFRKERKYRKINNLNLNTIDQVKRAMGMDHIQWTNLMQLFNSEESAFGIKYISRVSSHAQNKY